VDTESPEGRQQESTPEEARQTESLESLRQQALAAYLEQMSLTRDSTDGPAAVEMIFGPHRLELDPWETAVLERALAGDFDDAEEWPTLLAEGLAFQAKLLVDSESDGDAATPGREDAIRDQQLTNAAIGLSLLEETQRVINHMVLSGELNQAKKLSTFRNKIGHTVSELKDSLGPDDYERAEAMAQEMVPELEERPSATRREEPLRFDEPPATGAGTESRPAPRARRVKKKRPVDYTRPLLFLLAGLSVVWLVIAVPRLTHRPMTVLQPHDLPTHEAIDGISARPPSLYVDLDVEAWNGLSRGQRLELIEEIGSVAAGAGYTGAQFRVAERGTVGRWLERRGAELTAN
jgi:hypothetical protein